MVNKIIRHKIFFLTAMVIFFSSQAFADRVEEFLVKVESRFTAAKSKQEKFAIVSQVVNRKTLTSPEVSLDDNAALAKGTGPDPFTFTEEETGKTNDNFEKTNPLALAVKRADVERVRLFLSAVENVNDPLLTAWGFRQPYFLSHMALDPRDPNSPKGSLNRRMEIIDLLGEKGADFNIRPGFSSTGVYDNPPLIVVGLDGSDKRIDDLRPRALLYGADPIVKGSSASLVCINETPDRPLDTFGSVANELCEIAFDQYLKMPREQREKVRIADSVRKRFAEIKAERMKQLAETDF